MPHDESRVDDAGHDHVDILSRLRVVAQTLVALLEEAFHHDHSLLACVLHYACDRHPQRLLDDVLADPLVEVLRLHRVQALAGIKECAAPARHDALLNSGLCGVQSIVEPVFDLLHFHFGRAAHFDDGDASRQLRKALLELVAFVLRGGALHSSLNLLAPGQDVVLLACAVQDHGVVLCDRDSLCGAQDAGLKVLVELPASVFADQLSAAEHRNVLHHGLAVVTEAWRLHRCHLKASPQLVHDHGRQCLVLDVLRHYEQGPLDLGNVLQRRQDSLDCRDLLVEEQHQGIRELALLRLAVRDEVG
mmetsp:Transcript_36312/g.84476  ORF Transcript_36312/g.84476 Transcript_36312/m.84476 type:complete len:304 (+) Transcript_36312:440-1351(+)